MIRTSLALLVLALALPAAAQQDAARAAREREALRRAQSALKQAQDQQAALSREKTELSTEKDKLSANVKRAESQLGSARGESAKLRADVTRLSSELEASRAEAASEKKAMQVRSDELADRLARAERLLAERTQTVASTTGLLERSTQALAAAEKANREMHELGLQLIAQMRHGGAPQGDVVLGFGKVRLENSAEQFRDRLDALKLSQSK